MTAWQVGDRAEWCGKIVVLCKRQPYRDVWIVQEGDGVGFCVHSQELKLPPAFGPAKCTCDIRDLWARGHDEGCGERR